MRHKRKYIIKNKMEINAITMEERLKILANVIIDRILEEQNNILNKKEGDLILLLI